MCLVRKNNELNPMGNTLTGSGSAEPSHPSVLQHEGVQSEKDRLLTRSLNTSRRPHGGCGLGAAVVFVCGMLFRAHSLTQAARA